MIAVLAESGSLITGTVLPLSDEESHHLKVRRADPGETIRLFDGAGAIATGRLDWRGKQGLITIADVEQVARPAPVVLAVGAGDRDRFGWLAEKCAELGVSDLIPLTTEHAAAVATRLRENHHEKVASRAREAIKQSGAAWAPTVHRPQTVEQLCGRPLEGRRWLAQPGGSPPPAQLAAEPVTVAIGPEGGWSAAEVTRLTAAGFQPIALAATILRFETAALAAATVIAAARLRGAHD